MAHQFVGLNLPRVRRISISRREPQDTLTSIGQMMERELHNGMHVFCAWLSNVLLLRSAVYVMSTPWPTSNRCRRLASGDT